ncbi:MAG: triphosphoribosyl-dephospho-CoA synthase [Bdellovibrio sp.]|nr:triphosphoribosyl-dephospho-CoA synthase [Methylotenera sp.]
MVVDARDVTKQLSNAFKAACMAELEALKPGNVHIFADGHGMTVQDFILSAEATADVIALPDLSLGMRILKSVQATQNAVKTNTNLGIILLCVPLIHAAVVVDLQPNTLTFSQALEFVLANTSIADAEHVFAAIRIANPAGLGESAQHDVHQTATCTLLVAMQTAADCNSCQDMIALQYTNKYAQIIEGLMHYQQALARWQRPAWALTAVHLHFMAHYGDSHLVRKYGETIAKLVQNEALEHESIFLKMVNPKNYLAPLLHFDAALKKRGLNPGTSADLTVATRLMADLMARQS